MSKHRLIVTVEELDALPIGTVIVDPFDGIGDAPVVLCRAANRLWAALTTGLPDGQPWWTSRDVISASNGRLLAVYVPGDHKADR